MNNSATDIQKLSLRLLNRLHNYATLFVFLFILAFKTAETIFFNTIRNTVNGSMKKLISEQFLEIKFSPWTSATHIHTYIKRKNT